MNVLAVSFPALVYFSNTSCNLYVCAYIVLFSSDLVFGNQVCYFKLVAGINSSCQIMLDNNIFVRTIFYPTILHHYNLFFLAHHHIFSLGRSSCLCTICLSLHPLFLVSYGLLYIERFFFHFYFVLWDLLRSVNFSFCN